MLHWPTSIARVRALRSPRTDGYLAPNPSPGRRESAIGARPGRVVASSPEPPGRPRGGRSSEVLHGEGNGCGQNAIRTDREAVPALAAQLGHAQRRVVGLGLDADGVRLPVPRVVVGEGDLLPQPDAGEDVEWPGHARGEAEPIVADAIRPLGETVEEAEEEPRRRPRRQAVEARPGPGDGAAGLHADGVGQLDLEG